MILGTAIQLDMAMRNEQLEYQALEPSVKKTQA